MSAETKPTVHEVLARLEKDCAALPDALDVPPRVQEIAWQKRRVLEGRLSAIHTHTLRIQELDLKITPIEKWLSDLTAWRKTLCDELMASTAPRDRKAEDRLAAIKLSILTCDRGAQYFGSMCMTGKPLADMMREAGYEPAPGQNDVWSAGYGSITQTERLLDELRKERADAQVRLDAETVV